jgi:hypothetical protein
LQLADAELDDFLAHVVASNDLHARSDPPWTSLDATSRPALTVATGSQHPPGGICQHE